MAAPHFFEGLLSDTLCKLIDKTFATDTFKTDYNWNVNDGFTYDGFKYYIDIKKLDSINAKKIFFIPNKAPSELNRLAKDLDTLIYNIKVKSIDTLDTYLFQENLKRDYVERFGKLPKVRIEHGKFKPVKIQ